MTERHAWSEVREQRLGQPAARAAYAEARLAFEVGRQVRALRETRGISQRELAQRLGTTQSAVARLEGGGTHPTLVTLEKVAAALGSRVAVRFERPDTVAS